MVARLNSILTSTPVPVVLPLFPMLPTILTL